MAAHAHLDRAALRPRAAQLTIDFVVHGDTGVAAPWAIAAQPGEKLPAPGPRRRYAPRADADWHLLIGDDTVVPAIGATLERLPDRAVAHVIMAADEQPLSQPVRRSIGSTT